jgi:hypothetical protein
MPLTRRSRGLILNVFLYLTFCSVAGMFVADGTLHSPRRPLTPEDESTMIDSAHAIDADLQELPRRNLKGAYSTGSRITPNLRTRQRPGASRDPKRDSPWNPTFRKVRERWANRHSLHVVFAAAAFLHFLCTTCGQSRACALVIFSAARCFQQMRHCRALKLDSRQLFFHPDPFAKSAAKVFLSCTKNTELTARTLARTFSFASSERAATLVSHFYLTCLPDMRLHPDIDIQPANLLPLRLARMKAIETKTSETKTSQWQTYRTRFLVKAKQLSSSLVFTDSLGRQHSGRKGDYLVESSDGVLSIAPRQIFEDVYVSMPGAKAESIQVGNDLAPDEAARVRRKLPQPCGGPRPATRLGLM